MYVLVSRHKATIEWLRNEKHFSEDIRVLSHISSPDEIEGKIVIGNIPIHLAHYAKEVWNVTIDLPPELRGSDLTYSQFLDCNPRMERYVVKKLGGDIFE